ncbi:MAG: hypothetical protein ABIN94_01105 [Ferruginibacter sp.]
MSPKKAELTPGGETQVGVKNIPVLIMEKLQAIAGMEGVTYNELYNVAFANLVTAYEAKNGKVKPRPKGRGLEGL